MSAKEQEQEHKRSGGGHHGGSDRDVESDEEFHFVEPAEEAEEESKGRDHKKEPKTAE